MQPLAVADLAAEAIASFDAATLSRPTPIAVELEPDLTIVGDRATLVRAVGNLLINAWKYTGPDKRITLTARAVKRRVELKVADNGPGIDADERGVLFDGFTRGKAAAESRAPGVGLGLAIVHAIVRAHKGKVEVVSRPGEGATFRIVLRRPRPKVVPARAATAPPSISPSAPIRP